MSVSRRADPDPEVEVRSDHARGTDPAPPTGVHGPGSGLKVAELEERTAQLEEHTAELEERTAELEVQTAELEKVNEQLETANADMRALNRDLRHLATVDALTQLANRRRFDEGLDQEWKRARRSARSLALLICDIDFFKGYNDHYGHLGGDECLRLVAKALLSAARRPSDLVARFGGEEFAVLVPDTDGESAVSLAWQIQDGIAGARIPHAGSGISEFLTISIGVASRVPAPGASVEDLIGAADKALYAAKERGRNTCCLWGSTDATSP